MGTKLDSGAVLEASGFIAGAEYVRSIRRNNGVMCHVSVSKVGGGTRGDAYDGEWTVTLLKNGVIVYDQETMRTGTPKTHHEVAQMAVDFATAED